jgi:arylsulfatase A-like enzyme
MDKAKNKPNVVLITIDALRKDHLGCYGYTKNTSPFIDSLAKKSFIFDRAYSTGPDTPHSFPGLFTSNYCLVNNAFSIKGSKCTLAEAFKENGYHTIGFNASNPWVSSYQGYKRGFDSFFEFEDLHLGFNDSKNFRKVLLNKKTEAIKNKIRKLYSKSRLLEKIIYSRRYIYEVSSVLTDFKAPDYIIRKNKLRKEFLREIEKIICEHNNQPFFLWLHFMDVHEPYCPPQENQKNIGFKYSDYTINQLARQVRFTLFKIGERQLRKIVNLYDAEINFVDHQLQKIVSVLKHKFDKDMLVILTSDHGESFHDHKQLCHPPVLYNELINVPLIIHLPGQSNQVCTKELVSHLDLLPTLVEYIGLNICSITRKQMRGYSVSGILAGNIPKFNRKFAFSEVAYGKHNQILKLNPNDLTGKNKRYSVITKKWKLIWDRGKNKLELYNLENDFQERSNMIGENPELAKLLHRRIIKEKQRSELSYLTGKLSQIRHLIPV